MSDHLVSFQSILNLFVLVIVRHEIGWWGGRERARGELFETPMSCLVHTQVLFDDISQVNSGCAQGMKDIIESLSPELKKGL